MTSRKKTALVTGASSGLGLEFAHQLAARGMNLVITARRTERLEDLAKTLRETHDIEVKIVTLDLAQSSSAKKLFEQTEGSGTAIDVLINNAGFGTQGNFSEIPWETTAQQLQLNITTLTELTWLFMRAMGVRKTGYILNVASTGAYQSCPFYGTYAAGKAYVRNFTEAVSIEAKGSGVRLCCLCPGPTQSEFLVVSGHKGVPDASKYFFMSAKRCVRIGLSALFGHRMTIISGWTNSILAFFNRLVPRWLSVRVAGAIMKARE